MRIRSNSPVVRKRVRKVVPLYDLEHGKSVEVSVANFEKIWFGVITCPNPLTHPIKECRLLILEHNSEKVITEIIYSKIITKGVFYVNGIEERKRRLNVASLFFIDCKLKLTIGNPEDKEYEGIKCPLHLYYL